MKVLPREGSSCLPQLQVPPPSPVCGWLLGLASGSLPVMTHVSSPLSFRSMSFAHLSPSAFLFLPLSSAVAASPSPSIIPAYLFCLFLLQFSLLHSSPVDQEWTPDHTMGTHLSWVADFVKRFNLILLHRHSRTRA